MRRLLFLTGILFIMTTVSAQSVVSVAEDTPYENEGLEYGYYITNESKREVKGEPYERYEVNLYVTNKSGCIKIIPLKGYSSSGSSSSNDDVMIAEFNCTNATGKKLTAKKGTVTAKPWYTYVRIPDENVKDKYRMVNAQVGYAIRNGQTYTSRIIVIVPKGERPKINCRMVYLADIQ